MARPPAPTCSGSWSPPPSSSPSAPPSPCTCITGSGNTRAAGAGARRAADSMNAAPRRLQRDGHALMDRLEDHQHLPLRPKADVNAPAAPKAMPDAKFAESSKPLVRNYALLPGYMILL